MMIKASNILPGRGRKPYPAPSREGCLVVDVCEQCGRKSRQLHICGDRAYCSRCCPGCVPARGRT
jgi:hypothetical protein